LPPSVKTNKKHIRKRIFHLIFFLYAINKYH
jgi:hypothetical protein